MHLKKKYFFCQHNVIKKSHTKLSKNEPVYVWQRLVCSRWNGKEGSGNKYFKKSGQAGLRGGCLLEPPMNFGMENTKEETVHGERGDRKKKIKKRKLKLIKIWRKLKCWEITRSTRHPSILTEPNISRNIHHLSECGELPSQKSHFYRSGWGNLLPIYREHVDTGRLHIRINNSVFQKVQCDALSMKKTKKYSVHLCK